MQRVYHGVQLRPDVTHLAALMQDVAKVVCRGPCERVVRHHVMCCAFVCVALCALCLVCVGCGVLCVVCWLVCTGCCVPAVGGTVVCGLEWQVAAGSHF